MEYEEDLKETIDKLDSLLTSLRQIKKRAELELSETISLIRKLEHKKKEAQKFNEEKRLTPIDIHYLDTIPLKINLLEILKDMIYGTTAKELKEKFGYSNYKANSRIGYLRRWIRFLEYNNKKRIERHQEFVEKCLKKK